LSKSYRILLQFFLFSIFLLAGIPILLHFLLGLARGTFDRTELWMV
jgi:hypothetical protein